MREFSSFVLFVAFLLVPGWAAAECECTESSRHGSECPPYAVCTTYVGACGSGKAPLSVCTGVCSTGEVFRLVSDFRFVSSFDETVGYAGQFGLELIPPLLDGTLGVALTGRTNGFLSLGLAAMIPAGRNILLGLTAGPTLAQEFGARAAGRIEYFPQHLAPGFIPLQALSVVLEAGYQTSDFDVFVPEAMIGVRLWL